MMTLKALRKGKGATQQQMADYLGITRQAYSNYEAGKRSPDNGTLFKLAEYFDVSVDFLLRGMLPGETPQSDIFRRNAWDCLHMANDADIADSGAGESLSQLLDGYKPVTLEDAFAVADILGEPIGVLMGVDEPQSEAEEPALDEMRKLIQKLTPEQTEFLVAVAERMLEPIKAHVK